MDEFETTIDIDSILNDTSLNAELAALGWDDTPPMPVSKRPAAVPVASGASENRVRPSATESHGLEDHTFEHPDIGSIGMLDEDTIKLTDADMQDGDLLCDFEALQRGEDPVSRIAPIETLPPPKPIKVAAAALTKTASIPLQSTMLPPPPDADGAMSSQDAKRLATKYKREGNTEEALKWFRYAKMVDKGATPEYVVNQAQAAAVTVTRAQGREKAQITATTAGAATRVASSRIDAARLGDAFAPLETALNEASKAALRDAKASRSTDPRNATSRMREYKAYLQELAVLQSRRSIPGAAPAIFRWDVTRREVPVVNTDIAEDAIELCIEGAYSIASIMDGHHSKSIGLSYTLGIAKDEQPTVLPAVEYADGNAVFNHKVVSSVLKRSRNAELLYGRKKAVFDLVLHKGNFLFKSKEVLGQAVLPLNTLLKKCSCGGDLQLKAVGKENGGNDKVRKGTVLGGLLRVTARIRSPLMTPEVQIIEERKLVLEPWPAVVTAAATATSVSTAATDVNAVGETAGIKSTAPSTPTSSVAVAPAAPTVSDLTDREKHDPHSPDFIESNDVLESEIAESSTLLAQLNTKLRRSESEEDDLFNTNMRLQLLQTRLQILVYKVQSGELDMVGYLDRVRERIKRDQKMAVYFKAEGERVKLLRPSKSVEDPAAESKALIGHALRLMKRIKIMTQEVANAEEQMLAGGDEDEEDEVDDTSGGEVIGVEKGSGL